MVSRSAFSRFLENQKIEEEKRIKIKTEKKERQEKIQESAEKRRQEAMKDLTERVINLGKQVKERKRIEAKIKKLEIKKGLIPESVEWRTELKRMFGVETEEKKKLIDNVRTFFKKYTCGSIKELKLDDPEDIRLIYTITGCRNLKNK